MPAKISDAGFAERRFHAGAVALNYVVGPNQGPTWVIKGSCDYLNWTSAFAYLDAFQAGPAHLVYLAGTGHNVYQDQPHEFAENMKAFLRGEPLPNAYHSRSVSTDYKKGTRFHQFSKPLPPAEAPPPPVSPIKLMSYAIQANPEKPWKELIVMTVLFIWVLYRLATEAFGLR